MVKSETLKCETCWLQKILICLELQMGLLKTMEALVVLELPGWCLHIQS